MLRKEFLEHFKKLQSVFDKSLSNSKELEKLFNEASQKFINNLSEAREKKYNLNENNPLYKHIDNIFELYDSMCSQWVKNIKNATKGTEFREKYNDSLLIYVYGKVKSGKSSLGNYIVYGKTDPSDSDKNNGIRAKYFSHVNNEGVEGGDLTNEAEISKKFRVDATEATSSIQGFSIPGLTWVDSPGLHSVNQCNGDLAKEYVKHADLVIYTMTSGAPGRESDTEEVDYIMACEKKPVIVITGSDKVEEDEVDGKLVSNRIMKTDEDRLKQIKFVKEIVKKASSQDIDIISISAKYAEEHETDEEEIQISGVSKLFELLDSISQNDGIKLKINTPLSNLKVFIKDAYENTKEMQTKITELKTNVTINDDKLHSLFKNENLQGCMEVENKINNYLNSIYTVNTKTNSDEINRQLQQIDNHLADIISDVLEDKVQKALNNFLNNINNSAVKSIGSLNFQIPNFNIKKETIEYNDRYIPGTRKRNRGIGALLGLVGGAALAFCTGGTSLAISAAAAVGGTAGGIAGQISGEDGSVKKIKKEVNVGDNFEEIKKQIIKNAKDVFTAAFNNNVYEFYDETKNTINSFITESNKTIEKYKSEMDSIQNKIVSMLCK